MARAGTVPALVCVFVIVTSAPAWSQITNVIGRANLDGSNVEVLRTEPGWGCQIQVHPASGKMYWSHSDDACQSKDQEIRRANLNGSDLEVVVTGHRLSRVAGDHLYWVERTAEDFVQAFYRSALDGSGVELLGNPSGYAVGVLRVEPLSETYFRTPFDFEFLASSSIRSNLDGSGALVYPFRPFNSLALNSNATQMYGATAFTIPSTQEHWIARADVDGGNYTKLFEFGSTAFPRGVEFVDPWVFWQSFGFPNSRIERASDCDDFRAVLEADHFRAFTVDPLNGKIYWMANEAAHPASDPFVDPPESCRPAAVPASSVPAAVVAAGVLLVAVLLLGWIRRTR